MSAPAPPRADELDAIVALIAAQQRRPDRNITFLGVDETGIRAELDGLDVAWRETARVIRRADGTLLGVVVAEWDREAGRGWVHGPWVDGDDDDWDALARPLLDAARSQVPASIVDLELAGDLANVRLARLAADVGWPAGVVNHALVVETATGSSITPSLTIREAVDADRDDIALLHDREFPASYFTADQLLERHAAGEQVVLVAIDADDGFAGYAAGRVHPDGEGYLDFVAVDEPQRGTGAGRALMAAITPELLARSTGRVNLTVQDHRAPARAMYAALGWRLDASFRGYRSTNPAGNGAGPA